MDNLNKTFISALYRDSKLELKKYISLDCLKGIRSNQFFHGSNTYSIEIPKNPYFPKGFFFEAPSSDNATAAKQKFLNMLIDRLENNQLDDQNYPIILKPKLWKSEKTGQAKKLDQFFHKSSIKKKINSSAIDSLIEDSLSGKYTEKEFINLHAKNLRGFVIKDLMNLKELANFK